jgi:hypothetical protein
MRVDKELATEDSVVSKSIAYRCHLYKAVIAAALTVNLVSAWAQGAVVTSITPTSTGLSGIVVINGSGFGARKPTVVLVPASPMTNLKRGKVKVLASSDSMVEIQVISATAGDYVVSITPKVRGASTVFSPTDLTVRPPRISGYSSTEVQPGDDLTILGDSYGTKKGNVYLNGLKLKIVAGGWTDTAITVVIPFDSSFGLAQIEVTNRAGFDADTTVVVVAPPPRVLGVPEIFQHTQVWCWAAAEQMILEYYGFGYDQCLMATSLGEALYQTQLDCCSFPDDPACLNPGPLQFMQASLLSFGGLRSRITARLSFAQVVQQINQGRPFIIAYENSFEGHVVVVRGYDLATRSLFINDPATGAYQFVPYGVSLSYAGEYIWGQTITVAP